MRPLRLTYGIYVFVNLIKINYLLQIFIQSTLQLIVYCYSYIVTIMLEISVLVHYIVFCLVMTGTPGPNNIMSLTSGARVGFLHSIPMVLGTAIGIGLQLLAVGFGLGAIFDKIPEFHTILGIGGSLYLLWLAYHIARSGPMRFDDTDQGSIGFIGGAMFQWVNPKAWAITTSAATLYVPMSNYTANIIIAAAIITLIALPCVGAWALGGTVLKRFLQQPCYARIFNIAAALLLVAMTFLLLFSNIHQ